MASENEKKLEEQIKTLTTERKKIEADILALKNQIEGTEKKSVANLEKIIKLETLRLNSVEKEEEVRKKIEKIDKDTEKRTERAQKTQDDYIQGKETEADLAEQLQRQQIGINNLFKDYV
jgi:chromosome segregation ATPase